MENIPLPSVPPPSGHFCENTRGFPDATSVLIGSLDGLARPPLDCRFLPGLGHDELADSHSWSDSDSPGSAVHVPREVNSLLLTFVLKKLASLGVSGYLKLFSNLWGSWLQEIVLPHSVFLARLMECLFAELCFNRITLMPQLCPEDASTPPISPLLNVL